ncbi:MAG: NAD(+) diphosphatase, partial [Pseudomonadota bacterium]
MPQRASLMPQAFADNPLDRASAERKDPAWVAARLAEPGTRLLPFWRGRPLIGRSEDGGMELGWFPLDAVDGLLKDRPEPIFLGLKDGRPLFAQPTDDRAPLDEDPIWAHVGGFADLRATAGALTPAETGIAAQARSLIEWHKANGFCANCGAETVMADGGNRRQCLACETEHFPRTDPVAIMGVVSGDRLLMGRSVGWPEKMYSALAGFIEVGEGIEAAVRREVLEESGIIVDRVMYAGSQPWPFPSSLMIACFARAVSEEITIEPAEIAAARWFTREEVCEALEGDTAPGGFRGHEGGPLWLPPPQAIAHGLCRRWAEDPDFEI